MRLAKLFWRAESKESKKNDDDDNNNNHNNNGKGGTKKNKGKMILRHCPPMRQLLNMFFSHCSYYQGMKIKKQTHLGHYHLGYKLR